MVDFSATSVLKIFARCWCYVEAKSQLSGIWVRIPILRLSTEILVMPTPAVCKLGLKHPWFSSYRIRGDPERDNITITIFLSPAVDVLLPRKKCSAKTAYSLPTLKNCSVRSRPGPSGDTQQSARRPFTSPYCSLSCIQATVCNRWGRRRRRKR